MVRKFLISTFSIHTGNLLFCCNWCKKKKRKRKLFFDFKSHLVKKKLEVFSTIGQALFVTMQSKPKQKDWLVRIIRECYDSAYMLFCGKGKSLEFQFKLSHFLYDMLVQHFGVKSIVDQKLWELATTLRHHRSTDEEIRQFSDFVCESKCSLEFRYIFYRNSYYI